MATGIKICGIRDEREAVYLNNAHVNYAGMVLFCPKSTRNISMEKAKEILGVLDKRIKRVAVTVSPSIEEVGNIALAGFDYIQIHGEIPDGCLEQFNIPVIKAFNVNDVNDYKIYEKETNVIGYVFDAKEYGSGKTFDWDILENIPRKGKLFILAGGLTPENVEHAIKTVRPDVVDVSSGVEREDKKGKSESKIYEFVSAVRKCDYNEE